MMWKMFTQFFLVAYLKCWGSQFERPSVAEGSRWPGAGPWWSPEPHSRTSCYCISPSRAPSVSEDDKNSEASNESLTSNPGLNTNQRQQCVKKLLSEWKHPAKFWIWKCTVYKVIVSQKKESTLNHLNNSFLKRIPSRYRHDEMELISTNWTNHHILASRKRGVWKNELLTLL